MIEMVFKRKYPKPDVSDEDLDKLRRIKSSMKEEKRKVIRLSIILDYLEDYSDDRIAARNNINKNTVKKCLSKLREFGLDAALNDLPRPGKPRIITDDDKAWIINLACTKPSDHGYPDELWSYTIMVDYIRKNNPSLKNISRSTVYEILNNAEIKPHKVRYYVEKRDNNFEEKMATVLHVYKEIDMVNNGVIIPELRDTVTLSFDKKPGIQAISLTSKELPPVPGKHPSVTRDYEYRRLGTLSLLAGIDLHTGIVTEIVSRTHNSDDFIAFLKKLDSSYTKNKKIRIILDNLKVHTSDKTREYLLTVPNRFEFVFTPKHGSWLNIVEMLFSKLARTMLREIRVNTIDELKERIDKYFEEINRSPVIFRWKYKMDEI
ncbi:IS630 family transposase [Ferroplasma acidiphilum]|uniref:IS630 family transposase n=1 Tax=Ferroplasma acidiphilum TaxID=74969 RepID=UPI0018C8C22C|nr:IS630 family transposase [Ferroplasma acidiphilum]